MKVNKYSGVEGVCGRIWRIALAFIVLVAPMWAATVFDADDPYDQGNGDKYLDWFGWYNDSAYPWVYHYNLGWMFTTGSDSSSFWLYHADRGWLWSSRQSYPMLYSSEEADYLYYYKGTASPNWFFHYSVYRWLTNDQSEEMPYDRGLYLRGTLNDWAAVAGDQFKYVDGAYRLARRLEAGTYTFKIADADWTAGTDFGGLAAIDLGVPTALPSRQGGGDIELVIPISGEYEFTLSAEDPDLPVLTISEEAMQALPEGDIYLLGTFNGFAAVDSSKMTYLGGAKFHARLTVPVSLHEFRLGGTVAYGGVVGSAQVGRAFQLSAGSTQTVQMRFPKPGSYDVIADFSAGLETPQISVQYGGYLDLTQVSDELYLRGQLNGMEVYAPLERTGSRYEWTGKLEPGSHAFVLSDVGMSASLTFGGGVAVAPNITSALSRSAAEIALTVGALEGGVYTISLDLNDPANPALLVSKASVVLINYHRADDNYAGFGLHLWNVNGGDALPSTAETAWPQVRPLDGSTAFGRFTTLPIVDPNDTIGVVVHRNGAEKDIEINFSPSSVNQEIWLVSGIDGYFSSVEAAEAARKKIVRASARWLFADVIAWDIPGGGGYTYKLLSHPTGEILLDNGVVTVGEGGEEIPLALLERADARQMALDIYPFVTGWTLVDASALSDPRTALLGHVVVAAYDGAGRVVAASALQRSGVLDDLYYYDGPLGLEWVNGVPRVRVWAPTATRLQLRVASQPDLSAEVPGSPFPMTQVMENGRWTGVWEYTGPATWENHFYLYEVDVFVPKSQRVVRNLVTDPYSLSLSTNSTFSQMVRLDSPALQPEGWGSVAKSGMTPEDIVIYELHTRDFSIGDATVPTPMRGTFKAFTQLNSDGMRHLASLAEAGLSHVHLLPINDFGSVNESSPYLREFWPNPVGFGPASDRQQAIVESNSGMDGFNWGYDPYHYFVPEGSYATDPNGSARVLELREAVAALDQIGLRVIQDVVFNHTLEVGQQQRSVLDKVVPGYYYRLDGNGNVHSDVCCPELATEYLMTEKLMVDALVHWAKTYKIDGFRFDIMGDHTIDNLLKARAALSELTLEKDGVDGSRIYLYGEGWYFGSLLNYLSFKAAHQDNLGGTGVGSFNDRIRDGLGHKTEGGFIDGNFNRIDRVRNGLAGNIRGGKWPNIDPVGTYTEDPQETINHITVHDNYTLFDELQLRHGFAAAGRDDLAITLRRHRLALSAVAMGQGVPFFHAGVDVLRSKSGDRNSYNSGDWFNYVDWTYQDNNWAVGLPPNRDGNADNWPHFQAIFPNVALKPTSNDIQQSHAYFKELLRIRQSSELFRLETAAEIRLQLRFLNAETGNIPGLIALSITDPGTGDADLDPEREWVLVLFNGNYQSVTFSHEALTSAGMDLTLHPEQLASVDPVTASAQRTPTSGSITVPGLTMLVYTASVLPGLPDLPGNTAPYPRALYIRGEMNGWGNGGLGAEDRFTFLGDGMYQLDYPLAAQSYQFKIADANWTEGTNFGSSGTLQLGIPLNLDAGANPANMQITISESATYRFLLNASDPGRPVLTVTKL